MSAAKLSRNGKVYLALLVVVFVAGGIARLLQQTTRAEWLNGVVQSFAVLYVTLLIAPVVFVKKQDPHRWFKVLVGWLAGFALALLWVAVILGTALTLLKVLH